MERWQLEQRQALPLDVKVELTKLRIREYYERTDGGVYVSFSGGKDSTVLLDLVRSLYPDVPAVFVDTTLEYPQVKAFVRTIPNVTWLRPALPFHKVITKYGWPLVSKEIAQKIFKIRRYRLNQRTVDCWLNGSERGTMGKISDKWKYLLNAPVEINSYCCDVMKKRPAHQYDKSTGRVPFVGIMADNSRMRMQNYLRHGCNIYNTAKAKSTPMGFWTEQDVLQYIKINKLPYSSIYGDIVESEDKHGKPQLITTGEERTGCMFCPFGVHIEQKKGLNRFERMKVNNPKYYNFCLRGGQWMEASTSLGTKPWAPEGGKVWVPGNNGLGMKYIFDLLGIRY